MVLSNVVRAVDIRVNYLVMLKKFSFFVLGSILLLL